MGWKRFLIIVGGAIIGSRNPLSLDMGWKSQARLFRTNYPKLSQSAFAGYGLEEASGFAQKANCEPSQSAFAGYGPQILIALLIFGGLVTASIYKPTWHTSIAWAEAIAGLGTLLFAGLLWFNGIRREWEENLPKRMTVQYQWQGRNVMVCYDALLVSESDARTWALQIGQQMSGCQRLKFEPFFNLQQRGIQTEKANDKQYKGFVFTYYLTELPVPDGGAPENQAVFKARLENGCIERYPHYHQDGSISMEDGYIPSTNQKMVISH